MLYVLLLTSLLLNGSRNTNQIFVLFAVCLFVGFVISHFGFEDVILVLIVSFLVHCLLLLLMPTLSIALTNTMITCPCNVHPLTPHFYMVKLGFTGVYIFFLIFALKHKSWVLVRTASVRRF